MSKLKNLDALLEVGCEEIPARFMPGFLLDLKFKAEEKLKKERIGFGNIETFGTARRLVLSIQNISVNQTDLTEEVKGPPAEAAFDPDGKPKPAAIGFAKSQGVTLKDLKQRPVGNRNYVFAEVLKKGQPVETILKALFPEIILALYQPLAMRWGNYDIKFIRPFHWFLALCGNKTIQFELAGVKSSAFTRGHRYLKNSNFKLQTSKKENYIKVLAELGVIVDQEERKELIRKMVNAAAKREKGMALVEEDLLEEVTYLVENPSAYVGKFKDEFLALPRAVLITAMKKNQKYFPVLDEEGKLLANFVVVTDGCKNAKVVEGNEKVLTARLSDAKFFFEEDLKLPLKLRMTDLDRVSFFEKLGTISNKVERMVKLSEWLAKNLNLEEQEVACARRVAELSKADLTTKIVYEFPELQGVIGKEYALLGGEEPMVAEGIFEHYLPRYAEDQLPQSPAGTVVALADRIDTLVGCFSIGSIPSGSEDPYGLRRAVHGIIRMVLEKNIDLLLDEAISHSYKLYEPVFLGFLFAQGETGYQDSAKIKKRILDFIAGRLRPILLEKGIRYDVVEAVLVDFNDILDAQKKAQVLNKLVSESWFAGVVRSADRIARIAKEARREEVLEGDFVEKEEKELFDLYLKINWEVGEAIKQEDWMKAVKELAKLTEPIEKYFEKVLVMHGEEKIKLNRLALLKSIDKLYLQVADLRKIVL